LVRSPITCEAKEGICAKCAGVREKGRLPNIGEFVGIAAAQALSEPISQGQLRVKHTGGTLGDTKSRSGYELINQQVQVPKNYPQLQYYKYPNPSY